MIKEKLKKVNHKYLSIILICFFTSPVCASTNTQNSPHVKLRSLGLNDVQWTEGFMYDQWVQCRDVMIWDQWEKFNDPVINDAYANFLIAAGIESGSYKGPTWLDGDFYKWMEAASFILAQSQDPQLDALLDEIIDVIAQAQLENGYLYTKNQIAGNPVHLPGNFGAESYSYGHLFSAASVHFEATGKETFLDIARKAADHLVDFYPERPWWYWDHTLPMGLVELYRATGEVSYLDLVKSIINTKGHPEYTWNTDNTQDRVPLRDEQYAVGHAQRANYLYAGTADLLAEYEDSGLENAISLIWDDVVNRKMYITGGCGSIHEAESSYTPEAIISEAYGAPYDLPNRTAYNETCAQCGNILWNWRMLSLYGKAQYADIIELEYYNSALSGISRDGRHFFYTNVLERRIGDPLLSQDLQRRTLTATPNERYNGPQCCPPNIVRMIALSPTMAYSISDDKKVWVNLYGSNVINSTFTDQTELNLVQQAREYPWAGDIKLTVNASNTFGIMLRIPEWATGITIKVNNQLYNSESAIPGEYFEISSGSWSAGDEIDFQFGMPVKVLRDNELVTENIGKVSVKRGPVVYCLESVDLPDSINIDDILLVEYADLNPVKKNELLGGVVTLQGEAVTSGKTQPLELIPYFAWSNRGVSSMSVWLTEYDSTNNDPTPSFESDITSGAAPLSIQFNAEASFDVDDDTLSYFWDFADGTTSDEMNPLHTFMWKGNYKVTLTVDDKRGGKSQFSRIIEVSLNEQNSVVIKDFENAEDKIQGFVDTNWFPGCLVNLTRIDDPTGRSSGVMMVECDATKSDRASIKVNDLEPYDVPIISYLLYLPQDFPDQGLISVWGKENGNLGHWIATDFWGNQVPREKWFPVYFYMYDKYLADSSTFDPYNENYLGAAGLQFFFGQARSWKGTVFVDDMSFTTHDSLTVGLNSNDTFLPDKTTLNNNFPNPFNSSTTISFDLSKSTHVTLAIFNTLGQRVRTLLSQKINPGFHNVRWDGRNDLGQLQSSGIYYVQLRMGNVHLSQKIIMIK